MFAKNKQITTVVAVTVFAIVILAITVACGRSSDVSMSQDDTEAGGLTERVPDLLGYSLEVLTKEFESIGFIPSPVILISEEPENTVLFIDKMGLIVPVHATIEIFVSGGVPDFISEDPSASGDSSDLMPESPSATDTSQSSQPSREHEIYTMEFGGISWLVLEEEEDKVLLLSEFVLFDMPYNNVLESTTWENSSLRGYLNNEFFNSFSPEEREHIAVTRVINGDTLFIERAGYAEYTDLWSWTIPAGNDTDDRIFLLSRSEQRRYFPTDASRRARIMPDHPFSGNEEFWWWWLRTPWFGTFNVYVVAITGTDTVGYSATSNLPGPGVRPALWLYT